MGEYFAGGFEGLWGFGGIFYLNLLIYFFFLFWGTGGDEKDSIETSLYMLGCCIC